MVAADHPSPRSTSPTATATVDRWPKPATVNGCDQHGESQDNGLPASGLVRQPPHHGREREHPGDMQRDGEANDHQDVAGGGVTGVGGAAGPGHQFLQVQRRHGHNTHHDGMGADDGGQRQDGGR